MHKLNHKRISHSTLVGTISCKNLWKVGEGADWVGKCGLACAFFLQLIVPNKFGQTNKQVTGKELITKWHERRLIKPKPKSYWSRFDLNLWVRMNLFRIFRVMFRFQSHFRAWAIVLIIIIIINNIKHIDFAWLPHSLLNTFTACTSSTMYRVKKKYKLHRLLGIASILYHNVYIVNNRGTPI